MVELIDRQICFRLPDAGPPASPSGPFRLADTQAEALSDLLQVFACGEESAALAFAHFGVSPIEDAARRGLARVAKEELVHERLLRGLRNALPAPAPDRELRRALLRFYYGIAQADIGLHLASIAALDSAVCVILAALLEPDRPNRESRQSPRSCVASTATRPGMYGYRVAWRPRSLAGIPLARSPKMPDWASLAFSRAVVLHSKTWA